MISKVVRATDCLSVNPRRTVKAGPVAGDDALPSRRSSRHDTPEFSFRATSRRKSGRELLRAVALPGRRTPVDTIRQRATACYDLHMETVTHREMRNRSGEILRRVEAGESVQVSNNGHLAALIVPVGGDPLDGLIARGEARAALTGAEALAAIQRVASPVSSRDLVEDSRGRW